MIKQTKNTNAFEIKTDDNFESAINTFLETHQLQLDINKKKEDIQTLINSKNKEYIGDYVIANDFNLATETSKITLSYKENGDDLLVVKEMKKEQMEELTKLNNWNGSTVEEYLKEREFKSQNVNLPIEIIKTDSKVYRFYEAMDMDLEKYLEQHNQLPINESIILILKVCKGISELHNVGIVNLDIAPLNILINKNSIKLTDLDGASINNEGGEILKRNYLGNNRFTGAPELFNERPEFDKTVDVYATAACLFRLISGDWPYNIEQKTRQLPYEEKMLLFKKEHESGNIIFPELMPEQIRKIIQKGMSPEPQNRYQSIKEFALDLIDFYNSEEQFDKNEIERLNILLEDKRMEMVEIEKTIERIQSGTKSIVETNKEEKN